MDQKKIVVIGVIYNTYREATRYVESFSDASADDAILILVDNSSIPLPDGFKDFISTKIDVTYIRSETNTGYFGGARTGLDAWLKLAGSLPEWLLVTNTDITFTRHFFQQLLTIPASPKTGLVAPSIISQRFNSDYNPKILKRYPRERMLFYQKLYASFILQNIYTLGSRAKRLIKGRDIGPVLSKERSKPIMIYAPHGSCLVFHQNYFISGGDLNLPNFLFGEEIHVAECCHRAGLDIYYHPELIVHDYEHASTGMFISRRINRFYRESTEVILQRYYSSSKEEE